MTNCECVTPGKWSESGHTATAPKSVHFRHWQQLFPYIFCRRRGERSSNLVAVVPMFLDCTAAPLETWLTSSGISSLGISLSLSRYMSLSLRIAAQ